ncbi:carbohydrate ABC transporter permease [Alicyclobacillus shizuokensis]|uniref:carbohydrate ABC transporter permease n=1 Tax=Alicyclobacillus shizuokensis TaxID=392014 RepID=UPI00082AF596|nr:carbohydrate ABC transporter permease [Alicyclobacillus shizuokensis]
MYQNSRKPEVYRWWAYFPMVIIALLSIFPFYWMLISSFKTSTEITTLPPMWWPHVFDARPYSTVFHVLSFGRAILNSIIVTVLTTLGILITSIMAGYVFAKHQFKGKNTIFIGVLATMMVPSFVTLVPLYYMFNKVGLTDTYAALIIPNVANAFGIFLMRQFISNIPDELLEAAKIDGASEWTILWRIISPLLTPAVATLGMFAFVFQWNQFLWPLTVIHQSSMDTVVLALNSLESYTSSVQFTNVIMAGTVIGILPSVILFIWLQRYFVRGITMTGIKG